MRINNKDAAFISTGINYFCNLKIENMNRLSFYYILINLSKIEFLIRFIFTLGLINFLLLIISRIGYNLLYQFSLKKSLYIFFLIFLMHILASIWCREVDNNVFKIKSCGVGGFLALQCMCHKTYQLETQK